MLLYFKISGNQCQQTQIMSETLSPTWDQTLVFHDIVLHADGAVVGKNPPVVIIEIFDFDKIVGTAVLNFELN